MTEDTTETPESEGIGTEEVEDCGKITFSPGFQDIAD